MIKVIKEQLITIDLNKLNLINFIITLLNSLFIAIANEWTIIKSRRSSL